jgi:predicted DNA-binding transcriptional regulator AlpA
MSTLVGSSSVGRQIDSDDLIDAQGIAELLGLSQRNTVSSYQRRYPDMPRPLIDLGRGRCKLWLRSDIQRWRSQRPDSSTR